MKSAVLTTSSSCFSNLKLNSEIQVIPVHLDIENHDFIDGHDISNEELRETFLVNDQLKIESKPVTRHEISDIFAKLVNQGYDEVFITCLSSEVNDSYKIIRQVSYNFRHQMKIFVYDCKDMNVCEGVLANEAKQLIDAGTGLFEIASHLDAIRNKHKMFVALSDPKHFNRYHPSPSTVKNLFSTLIDHKCVLELDSSGDFINQNKARDINKSFQYIFNNLKTLITHPKSFVYVLCSGDTELTAAFVNKLKTEFNIDDIPVFPASSVSIAQHGIHAVSLCTFNSISKTAENFLSQLPSLTIGK